MIKALDKGIQPIATITEAKLTTTKQDKWISDLMYCESRNDTLAVNPKDLDGTASYSLFQWKPSTFKAYVKKYDLFDWQTWEKADWWNAMFSDYHQMTVIQYMINDLSIKWNKEFPWCVKKIGLPLTKWIHT